MEDQSAAGDHRGLALYPRPAAGQDALDRFRDPAGPCLRPFRGEDPESPELLFRRGPSLEEGLGPGRLAQGLEKVRGNGSAPADPVDVVEAVPGPLRLAASILAAPKGLAHPRR
jgi:hypothetical protein